MPSCLPTPSDVFGKPQNARGEDVDEGESWARWLLYPRHRIINYELSNNIKAAFTTALIGVPMSISFAIASGGTPVQGITCAVWAGVVGALFGSSHFNVIGPSGALCGLLILLSNRYGSSMLPIASVMTSVWLFILTLFNAHRWIRFVSKGVSVGFCIGVAVMMIVSQVPAALGLSGLTPRDSVIDFVKEDLFHLSSIRTYDLYVFLCTLVPLFHLLNMGSRIPWQVVFSFVGIAVGWLLPHGSVVLLSDKYPNMHISVGSFLFLNVPSEFWDTVYLDLHRVDLWVYTFGVAVVALLETLLSSRIANDLTPDKAFLNYSPKRDALGLGLANLIAGCMQGIPATASLGRTILGVKTGAYSRISGCISAMCIAATAACLPLFLLMPLSSVAAMIMITSIRLVDFEELRHIHAVDVANMYSIVVTATACILTDTFTGLVIGIAISVALSFTSFRGPQDCVQLTVMEPGELSVQRTARQTVVHVTVTADFIFNNATEIYDVVSRGPLEKIQPFMNLYVNHSDNQGLPEGIAGNTPLRARHLKLVINLAGCTRMDFDGSVTLAELIDLYRRREWFVEVINYQHLGNSLRLCLPLHELEKLEYVQV